ncbi:hypothetical protein Tco_1288027, partial [Tanacetum coccineum]
MLKGILTRSIVAKLIAASASECLFDDFLSEIEPKKVSEALKHLGWSLALNGCPRNRKMKWELLSGTKHDWLLKVLVKKKELNMMKPLHHEFPDYVCKLDKALYGLKQVPMT